MHLPASGRKLAYSLHSLAVACLLLTSPFTVAAATLEVTPSFVSLGSFSTLEPIDNEFMPGRTTIRILSDQTWRLDLRLTGPIRLRGSALVLPLARAFETHPYIPAAFINLQSRVVMSGPASAEPQEFTRDWLELQSLLQEYLTQEDPAGTYELTLVGRLIDATGAPLTDPVEVTVEFDIVPWVDIADPLLPDFRVPVRNGASDGESWVVPITLRSNTGWRLTVSARGRLLNESGTIEYELRTLTVCTEDAGTPAPRSGCVPLSTEPAVVAEGSAPLPFSLATVDVPVKFRFLADSVIPVGHYGVTVSFTAHAVARPP